MSAAATANWACNFIIGLSFPSLNAALGEWTFVPFGIVVLCCCIFISVYDPAQMGDGEGGAGRRRSSSRSLMSRSLPTTDEGAMEWGDVAGEDSSDYSDDFDFIGGGVEDLPKRFKKRF